jgi:hypothetical protein
MESRITMEKFTIAKDGGTAAKHKNLPIIGGMIIQKDG